MKKNLLLTLIFISVIAVSFVLGVCVQQHHLLHPIKRVLRGLPFKTPPANNSILEWHNERDHAFFPQYVLSKLTLQDIQQDRKLYVTKLEELLKLSTMPQAYKTSSIIVERVELDQVFREKIKIQVEPRLWIPFYLFVPKNSLTGNPAILVVHGHSAGKIETAGLASSYQKGNALALAEAGFVTIAPDLRGFGELGWIGDWDDPDGHTMARNIHIQDALENIRQGRTLLGSYLYDLSKIVTYLETRKEVDIERLGITGTSMGGDIAIWMAALDLRFKVIVASASSIVKTPDERNPEESFHTCIDPIPGIRKVFRPHEIPLLIAPRPLLLDLNEKQIGIPEVREKIEEFYTEAEKPKAFSIHFHRDGENYHNKVAIHWFKHWL